MPDTAPAPATAAADERQSLVFEPTYLLPLDPSRSRYFFAGPAPFPMDRDHVAADLVDRLLNVHGSLFRILAVETFRTPDGLVRPGEPIGLTVEKHVPPPAPHDSATDPDPYPYPYRTQALAILDDLIEQAAKDKTSLPPAASLLAIASILASSLPNPGDRLHLARHLAQSPAYAHYSLAGVLRIVRDLLAEGLPTP